MATFQESPWRWAAGVEAAVAIGVPLAAFTAAGEQKLGLIATLGGFTALYGSTLRLGDRAYLLPFVAAGFVAASGLGVLSAGHGGWLNAFCLVLVAALSCAAGFGIRLGPPGPTQFVLVAGIGNYLATRAEDLPVGPAAIPMLVTVGAVSAYALVIAPLALPGVRRRVGSVMRLGVVAWRGFDRDTATIAVRVLAAVAVAALLSVELGVRRSYWIVTVAGAALQASHVSRLGAMRAVHRLLGTVLGVGLYGVVALSEPRGLWLVVILTLLQFGIEVVVARHYALALVFITPTALSIAAAAGGEDRLSLVGERVVDTALGAAIAMGVLWVDGWARRKRAG